MKRLQLIQLSLIGFSIIAFSSCSTTQKTEETTTPEVLVSSSVLDSNIVADALPFTIEFVEQNYGSKPALPSLQSYVSAMNQAGEIFVAGGRRQGLHTFNPAPATNFEKDSANNFLFIIDPVAGDQWSFDVNQLGDELSAPLQANNLQSYHDEASDFMYIVGGYGWKADGSDMVTFGTVIRFKLEDISAAIKSGAPASSVKALMQIGNDDRLAITGGELFMLNGSFYLVFGQRFDGQYRAFGGTDFTQEYSNAFRVFRLDPQTLKITAYGATQNSGADKPFHRRDGNIFESIDPATGMANITALGGVFKPGIIGGYDYPIFISSPSGVVMDSTVHQRFSQYECPVITIYNETAQDTSLYHTMFGGISMYYYSQTPDQRAVFDSATMQGRNDGLPFIADISTFQKSSTGTYQEFIQPEPIAGNRLLGSSITFIGNRSLEADLMAFDNGVIKLNKVPVGAKILAGYIYGGIEAQNPFPSIPNEGTWASNTLFAVYVTNSPSGAIPASFATKARNGAPLTRLPH
ncbi:hypothetical protein [Algoriphagus chordae]|uniref:Uncharacterized protein n=1 Tax=Algoriphagus chordae TaxID=237019 RepID=A0A2W7RG27_9BACT|nr:hypothetical protein [Algoriphagus chordae]PZX58066.1 hypothetical protein LV85_00252 [Algoriphagus chordae]